MKTKLLAGIALLLFAIPAVAQYNPPPGGEDLYDLYSPELLAQGAPAVGGSGPQADAINPATSGLVQRTTLDASYLGLTGFDSSLAGGGWQGHVVNLGVVSPTRVGVFSGSAHFVSLPLDGMPWGTMGFVHASASKELYPGWIAGLGVRLGGGGSDRFDLGAALDLGVIRDGSALFGLDGVRWGIALQNVGKWYVPNSNFEALPAPFTPSAGVEIRALSTDWLTITTSGSASAPAFQNLRLGLGMEAELFNAVSVHGGWGFDLRETLDDALPNRSVLPSFGLSATFRAGLGRDGFAAEQGWTETEVKTTFAAAPLYNDIWAIGGGINAPLGVIDTAGPSVTIDYPERLVISPNNDGTQDSLIVPVEITDERFVLGWQFEVADESGTRIRSIANKEDRPENTGFQNIVDRITEVRSGVPVPETIRWDGRDEDGELVADGEYQFVLTAVDDNGNRGGSSTYSVLVDATPPTVTLTSSSAEERIFSPNDDGSRDSLAIEQMGSVESEWLLQVVNGSGTVVWTDSITQGAPVPIAWDGRGNDGLVQPDGVYRYRISATDAGGNRASAELANIIINTEPTPVALAISTADFSPNGDGRKDTIRIAPSVTARNGIQSWSLVIRRADGRTVREFTSLPDLPTEVDFDGRDDSGARLSEGEYFAELEVGYQNGNTPSAQSAPFRLDVTPPRADVRADLTLFSPNGDDTLDTVTIFQEASRETSWVGTFRDAAGRAVRRVTWTDLPQNRLAWNGRQDDGRLAADGAYTYVLSSEDAAGNIGSSTPIQIAIDTRESQVGIRAEFDAFSPNADARLDRQRLFVRIDEPDLLDRYVVTVVDARGSEVRRFEGISVPNDPISWDGTLESGRRAPDGEYRARMSAAFSNGTQIDAQTARFVVDTVAPSVALQNEFTLFSPDGDGNRDTLTVRHEATRETGWIGEIRDASGMLIREYRTAGVPSMLVWDGTDSAGNAAPDGAYEYHVRASDRAGNEGSARLSGIRIDTRTPRLFVTASRSAISPNGDGVLDDLEFTLYANLLDGAERWELAIRDTAGTLIRQFTGDELQAERVIRWDGTDGRGRIRDGEFRATFEASYTKGNEAEALAPAVRVDTTPPAVNVQLAPLPFSPDNDGVNDELAIRLNATDQSPIQAWRFEILDRNERFFAEFTGRGEPASSLLWNGRASDGELVISAEDYPYRLTIQDELGNRTVSEGVIPIDILVVRDGDRLKVQISNITFAPNSPALILDPTDERGARNLAILERLAEVFDKYSSYAIRIEGHAVNVTGTEREEREELQPLSLARAETVKAAMIEAGIAERRVSTLGRGGTEPIVPHTDTDNRWKNRRVEFVLIR